MLTDEELEEMWPEAQPRVRRFYIQLVERGLLPMLITEETFSSVINEIIKTHFVEKKQ